MQPLRADQAGLSASSKAGNGRNLDELRRTIARLQAPSASLETPGESPLGIPEIDRVLGGGLAHGALHEVAACGEPHMAAATGFVLGVAALSSCAGLFPSPLRGRGREEGGCLHSALSLTPLPHGLRPVDLPHKGEGEERRTIVWVAEDMALIESGAPYGPGLDGHGLAPEKLLTVRGAKADDVLWAMEEALHCRAVGVVIGEIRGTSKEVDLVATRRLSLAAAAHGALALILRTTPVREASASVTRWIVGSAPSLPSPEREGKGGPGPPCFDLSLVRNRRGPLGSWMLAWSVSDVSFVLATNPQPVARTAADRPHRARAA